MVRKVDCPARCVIGQFAAGNVRTCPMPKEATVAAAAQYNIRPIDHDSVIDRNETGEEQFLTRRVTPSASD